MYRSAVFFTGCREMKKSRRPKLRQRLRQLNLPEAGAPKPKAGRTGLTGSTSTTAGYAGETRTASKGVSYRKFLF